MQIRLTRIWVFGWGYIVSSQNFFFFDWKLSTLNYPEVQPSKLQLSKWEVSLDNAYFDNLDNGLSNNFTKNLQYRKTFIDILLNL
jgi:hypothetical protein